jgi:hypothetical protein
MLRELPVTPENYSRIMRMKDLLKIDDMNQLIYRAFLALENETKNQPETTAGESSEVGEDADNDHPKPHKGDSGEAGQQTHAHKPDHSQKHVDHGKKPKP